MKKIPNDHIFTIDVSSLLGSHEGDFEEYDFQDAITEDIFTDIICLSDLQMHIKIIRKKYGLDVILSDLEVTVDIASESISEHQIKIPEVIREFHISPADDHPDDISYIQTQQGVINITEILEQEILIVSL